MVEEAEYQPGLELDKGPGFYPEEDSYDDEQNIAPYDYPVPKPGESLYTLFQNVLKLQDNSKVAWLTTGELGELNISVRDCQRIALISKTLHHPTFADFFRESGEIILRTSASRKGWFTELFVSQKKLAATKSTQQQLVSGPPKQRKWLFAKQQHQPE